MSRQMEKLVEGMLSGDMIDEQRRLMGLEPTLPTLEEAKGVKKQEEEKTEEKK
jgi:hypothetical protein